MSYNYLTNCSGLRGLPTYVAVGDGAIDRHICDA
jgi:hypothetical protein